MRRLPEVRKGILTKKTGGELSDRLLGLARAGSFDCVAVLCDGNSAQDDRVVGELKHLESCIWIWPE
jgi:hypothetical protein